MVLIAPGHDARIFATGGPEEILVVERLSEVYGVPVNVRRLAGKLTICVPAMRRSRANSIALTTATRCDK